MSRLSNAICNTMPIDRRLAGQAYSDSMCRSRRWHRRANPHGMEAALEPPRRSSRSFPFKAGLSANVSLQGCDQQRKTTIGKPFLEKNVWALLIRGCIRDGHVDGDATTVCLTSGCCAQATPAQICTKNRDAAVSCISTVASTASKRAAACSQHHFIGGLPRARALRRARRRRGWSGWPARASGCRTAAGRAPASTAAKRARRLGRESK